MNLHSTRFPLYCNTLFFFAQRIFAVHLSQYPIKCLPRLTIVQNADVGCSETMGLVSDKLYFRLQLTLEGDGSVFQARLTVHWAATSRA